MKILAINVVILSAAEGSMRLCLKEISTVVAQRNGEISTRFLENIPSALIRWNRFLHSFFAYRQTRSKLKK